MAAQRPTVAWLTWPPTEIAGGIKAAFGQAALLREAGWPSVVGSEGGQAPTWFSTEVPVHGLDALPDDAVLVLPENHPGLLDRFAADPRRKLVFCQNPHYAWQGLRGEASYARWGVQSLLVPSATVQRWAMRRLPDLPAYLAPFSIDERRFVCPPDKRLQVACMPRKRPLEFSAIHDLAVAAEPALAQIPWVVLQGATEAEVAQALGDSAVYLSLARLEAHAMSTLEAMACGCVVAGFSGVAGGSDSQTAANGLWAAEDDIEGCVRQLVQAVSLVTAAGPAWQSMVAASRQTAWSWRREESRRRLVAALEAALA